MAGPHQQPGTRPAVKLTYDDFVHFPDDGRRHELIDGEHYVTPSPNLRHQRIAGQLYLAIGLYLRRDRLERHAQAGRNNQTLFVRACGC